MLWGLLLMLWSSSGSSSLGSSTVMAALRKSFFQDSQHSSDVIKQPLLCSDFWLENLKRVKFDSRDRFVSVLIFNLSVPSAVVSVKHFSPWEWHQILGVKHKQSCQMLVDQEPVLKACPSFRGFRSWTFFSSLNIVFWIFNWLVNSNCYIGMEECYGPDSLAGISAIVRSGSEC